MAPAKVWSVNRSIRSNRRRLRAIRMELSRIISSRSISDIAFSRDAMGFAGTGAAGSKDLWANDQPRHSSNQSTTSGAGFAELLGHRSCAGIVLGGEPVLAANGPT